MQLAVSADTSKPDLVSSAMGEKTAITKSTNSHYYETFNKIDDHSVDTKLLIEKNGKNSSDIQAQEKAKRGVSLYWTSNNEADSALIAENEDIDSITQPITSASTNTTAAAVPIMDTMRAYINAATSRLFTNKAKGDVVNGHLTNAIDGQHRESTTTPVSRVGSPQIDPSSQPPPPLQQQPALRHRGRSLRRLPQRRYTELNGRSSSLPPEAVRARSSVGSIGLSASASLSTRTNGQRSPLFARFPVADYQQPMSRAHSTQPPMVSSNLAETVSTIHSSTAVTSNITGNNYNYNIMATEQLLGPQGAPILDSIPAFAPPIPAEDLDRLWATVAESITADNSIIITGVDTDDDVDHNSSSEVKTHGKARVLPATSTPIDLSHTTANGNTISTSTANTRPSAMVTYGPAAGLLPYDLISSAVYSNAYPELYPRVYPPTRSLASSPPLHHLPHHQHGINSITIDKSGRSSAGSSAAASVCSVPQYMQTTNEGPDDDAPSYTSRDKRNLLRQNRLLRTQLETTRAQLEQAKCDVRQERTARRIIEQCHQRARDTWDTDMQERNGELVAAHDEIRRLRDLVDSLGGDPDSGKTELFDNTATNSIADKKSAIESSDNNSNQEDYPNNWYDAGIGGERHPTSGVVGGPLRRRGTIVHLRPVLLRRKKSLIPPMYRIE
ncbi:hypothetical protein BDF19DRAFT_46450 [Syncephalis fuscata]|nr:hypothetical protein BDF19DRAFT_46450 [Syncephalis fuscata]